MAIACITPVVAAKMKQAVKDGEISIKDLYDMSSSERRGIFERYVDRDLAKFINTNFEKAIISKQKNALQKWASETFKPTEIKKEGYKNVLDHIAELDKLGVLTPAKAEAFLSDLVAERMGVTLSLPEVRAIQDRAKKLQDLFLTAEKTPDGMPVDEYWTEARAMRDYIDSLNPSHKLKVATSIIGRGSMLASVKSPTTNIISNTAQGIVQTFERRLVQKTYWGLNGDAALAYVKRVNKIFQASGFDISRMDTFKEGVGAKFHGEDITHSQGPGAVRAVGRFYEDIVFKQLMTAPDVAFSSVAFADTANLASTAIARGQGLTGAKAKARALEIMQDSFNIEPKTIEGQAVRGQAIAQAQYSTYTNKGGYAEFALGLRNVLNNASGDIRLGDQLMPFVKTPANVVQASVDASGIRLLEAAWKLPGALKDAQLKNPAPLREVTNLAIRSGLGLTMAFIVSQMIKPEDFLGEWEALSPQQRNLARAKGAPFNSIKVGGNWISLDYFGPLAAPIVGMLYAKKYGTDIPSALGYYAKGVGSQAMKVPGLKEFSTLVDNMRTTLQQSGKNLAKGLSDQAIGYIRARTIPAIFGDLAKGTDPFERKSGGSAIGALQAGIPGAREKLPIKRDLEGQAIKGEGIVSALLFGSRVQTANESKLVKEISRLYDAGEGPAISDVERTNKRVQELKLQVPADKYEEAIKFNGEMYARIAGRIIASARYKRSEDSDKKKFLDNARNDALDMMLVKFRYRKPRPQRGTQK